MSTSEQYKQKAKAVQNDEHQAKKKSCGPCFIIVNEDNPDDAHAWCIESDHEPTPGEVRATAEKRARLCHASYNRRYRWERYHEAPVQEDGLTGKEALAMAKQNILAGLDTPGKRFLLRLKKDQTLRDGVVRSMTANLPIPKSVAEQVRAMYAKPIPTGAGPIEFEPGEHDITDD